MYFRNSFDEKFDLQEMLASIFSFISENYNAEYSLFVGSDSQVTNYKTIYVTAVVIHRQGGGAKLFYSKERVRAHHKIHERIYKETEKSIEILKSLEREGIEALIPQSNIEVHIDAGPNGKSEDVLKACVGWVLGVGYLPKTKPDAYGASCVADKYTRN